MKTIEVDKALLKSLLVMASVVEARDPFTAGHVWRTSRYCRILAEEAGLSNGDIFLAELGGLVHDLGKIGIPDAVLNKKGRLTPQEYEQIKTHPEVGRRVIANHPLAPLVESAIAFHHVRYDRKGYPPITDEVDISSIPHIVSIADAFDAITSSRPYRGRAGVDRAIEALEEERGKQFHPSFAVAFLKLVRGGALDHYIGHSSENGLMLLCPDCGPILTPPAGASDGDTVDCPSCRGEFSLHINSGAFDLEWTGTRPDPYLPQPDLDVVDQVLQQAPRNIKIPGE